MRIALLSAISSAIPPDGYGGVEAVVGVLSDGLVDAGHDVTLFATGDSKTKARLVSVVDEAPPQPGRPEDAEVHHAAECARLAGEFELVSSHVGVLGGAVLGAVPTPSLHTVADPVDRTAPIWASIGALHPELRLASTSQHQQELAPHLPWIANCYNGLDPARYPYSDGAGDYLAFLGRMSPDKGCHDAIDVARAAGLPLRIGAKLEEAHEHEYFEECIRPELGDGVEFLGELSHREKVELLGGATALLFPTATEEAFGLVLIESMACGTPVVAVARGAVPEVVDDGHTGILVEDVGEMAAAVTRAVGLDRGACRTRVTERFSVENLVAAYEEAFAALTSGAR
jgi:glycosyltransferase involved in cell wall biosynthesis